MKLPLSLVSVVLVALVGCASTHDHGNVSQALRDVTGQNGRACVRTRDIQGYGARQDNVINIDARRGYYVATVRPGCHDLATSMAAMFNGDIFEICGGRTDSVAAGGSQCTIDKIFEFQDRASAFEAYDAATQGGEQATYDHNVNDTPTP